MTHVIGVDGGGSTVRVIITGPELAIKAEYIGPTVNPSLIGREEAASRIQMGVGQVLRQAGMSPQQISAVGIGVAGASIRHAWAVAWMHETITGVLPQARVVPSADYEIALVAAHGERIGVLLLAGTGSLAYGVNAAGETALVGAWGYLLGDEGGGYWLGIRALQAVARQADGRGRKTLLYDSLVESLGFTQPLDLLGWMYGGESRVGDVARLAPLVLACAGQGDPVARAIVEEGARELALSARTVAQRLGLHGHPPAFAGSVLTTGNSLSRRVCDLLGLDAVPTPKYTPVMGAALLALSAVDD